MHFVTQLERMVVKTETVGSNGIRGDVHLSVSLCRVVGIAHVIEETEPCINSSASLEEQFSLSDIPFSKGILPVILEVVKATKLIVIVLSVMNREQLGMMNQFT